MVILTIKIVSLYYKESPATIRDTSNSNTCIWDGNVALN